MSGTDLVLHTLTIEGASAEPTGLIVPGTGEVVSLDDPAGVAHWIRAMRDIEDESIRPAKALAAAALYHHMDAQGRWTLHFDRLEVSGEATATWEGATKTDGAGLFDDLVTLRQREGDSLDEAKAWALELFKVEMTLTASGKARLGKMRQSYREALESHTVPLERARRAPSVKRI